MPPRRKNGTAKAPPIHFETKVLREPNKCRCGASVYMTTVLGELRYIDAAPISLRAEMMCVVMDIETYVVYGKNPRPSWRRPEHRDDGYPRYGDLLSQHRCGVSWADYPAPQRWLQPEECPF